MRVYGLDFTSAPDSTASKAKKQKRLMLAVCKLEAESLKVENFEGLNTNEQGSFAEFERWLSKNESWIAGIDFPFGQPAELVKELNWPGSWDEYVKHVEKLGKEGFERALVNYKASKEEGKKHLFREIDKLTNSQSPMTLDYTPVGKMFFQGAYRLCNSNVSIVPLRKLADSNKIAIEAYPALVARKWIGLKQGYKNDDPQKSDEYMMYARHDIVSAIRGLDKNNCRVPFKERYGFTVVMNDNDAKQCVDDCTGDLLDSVLCAVQAAWAYGKRSENYGIPVSANPLEGWICDPDTFRESVLNKANV
jgi:hypothetical protein